MTIYREIIGHTLQHYMEPGSLIILGDVNILIDRVRHLVTLSITRNNLKHIFMLISPTETTHVTVEKERMITQDIQHKETKLKDNMSESMMCQNDKNRNEAGVRDGSKVSHLTIQQTKYSFNRDVLKCKCQKDNNKTPSKIQCIKAKRKCKQNTEQDNVSDSYNEMCGLLAKSRRYITVIEKQEPY